MTPVVLDASEGVELLLHSGAGRRVGTAIDGSTIDGIPFTDPVQQWCDLRDLGGEDRLEAADRLRRAIVTRTIAIAA